MATPSLLELAVGGLPFPHGGPAREWRYRHAVRPEGPSALDHQAVADFIAYESAHGRRVEVVADPSLSDWATWPSPASRPNPGAFATQCCTHAYSDGCGSELVCHGAPVAVASRILGDGVLRSAAAVTGRDPRDLAAASTWGEPADYFDYIMFANGRCTAPEAVAASRSLGRDLVPSDLDAGYAPAVRFYFMWEALTAHPDARFDGVHPVKIHHELALDEFLVAVVVPSNAHHVVTAARDRMVERVVVLDADEPRPDEWATAALAAVSRRRSR